jgi:type IV pilus assembly protein PilE
MAPQQARRAGFTLIECACVLAVTAVLASLTLPSWRQHELQAARLDAVHALTRIQIAQEQHRASHGAYAAELGAIAGLAASSDQGRYSLALVPTGAEAYRATATARGAQAADAACAAITLEVRQGYAAMGPSARCWNR